MGWLTPAPVDVALLPIWGWGPKLGPGHMDPEEAARAAALLRPTTVVPIHWGTYFPHLIGRRRDIAFSQPPQRFADAMARRAPTVGVELLRPGDVARAARPRDGAQLCATTMRTPGRACRIALDMRSAKVDGAPRT